MINISLKTTLLSVLLFTGIFQDHDKKTVLIIGDSISIGYFPFVEKTLNEKAVVVHNKGNAQHTGTGLKNIESWLGTTKWDIIHFNWGLWDLCYRNPESKEQGNRDKIHGKITFTPEQYEKNLRELIERLKKTNATLIFAETTVVPTKEAGRIAGDELRYNEIALRLMKEYGIQITRLHKLSSQVHSKFGNGDDDVHYTERGYELLAKSVSKSIKTALKAK